MYAHITITKKLENCDYWHWPNNFADTPTNKLEVNIQYCFLIRFKTLDASFKTLGAGFKTLDASFKTLDEVTLQLKIHIHFISWWIQNQ